MDDVTLSPKEWDLLLNFKGYGRVNAPVWFMGIEEGGDSSVQHLKNRASKHLEFEDLAEAHVKMKADINASCTDTWWIMSRIMLYAKGIAEWHATDVARTYRNSRLGSRDGDTLLTDLLPIPAKDLGSWIHGDRYETKDQYREAVVTNRIAMLRSMLRAGQPSMSSAMGRHTGHNLSVCFPMPNSPRLPGLIWRSPGRPQRR